MTKQNRQEELHTRKVKPLNNDLTRLSREEKNISKRKKVLLRRRMAVYFVIAVIVLGGLISTNTAYKERLAAKESYKNEVTKQLEDVTETQEILKLQITKLEDDEYIAKLARKEYFLSEQGEIIFTIPKEQNGASKEDDK